MEEFQFEVGLLDRPLSIPEYRQDYVPFEGLRSTGIFVSAYLTGRSGRRYHGQRAFDDVEIGTSHVYSLCSLVPGDRTRSAPELWPSPRAGTRQEYAYVQEPDVVRFSNDDAEVELREGRWHWRDAAGRWDLSVEREGDRGYWFWVPAQHDIPVCQYHRSEMGRASGTVEGDPVEGFTYLDYSWGPLGIEFQFFDLPLIRKMNKAWMSWGARFADGTFTTGAARKGRAGVNWSMAYVVRDGTGKVITPTTTDLEYDENGIIRRARLDTGEEWFDFDQECSSMWPLHTVGRVRAVSWGAEIVDSWTNMEWMPDNADTMLQAWAEGRVSAKDMAAMRIEDERMVIPDLIG